jgi:hypothetical protein
MEWCAVWRGCRHSENEASLAGLGQFIRSRTLNNGLCQTLGELQAITQTYPLGASDAILERFSLGLGDTKRIEVPTRAGCLYNKEAPSDALFDQTSRR